MLLGLVAVVVPVSVITLLVVGVDRRLDRQLAEELDRQAETQMHRVAADVLAMVRSQHEALAQSLAGNQRVLHRELERAGAPQLLEGATNWTATDQLRGVGHTVSMPRFALGGEVASPAWARAERVPVLDAVVAQVGGAVTVFQRMNRAGDMLRVATTVRGKDGRRAVGTYIPATNPDGAPNPIVAAVLSGTTYTGRAFVVDAWYQGVYEPLVERGRVIGMLFVGERQERVASLREGIRSAQFGQSGRVRVYGASGDQRGRLIIGAAPAEDGTAEGALGAATDLRRLPVAVLDSARQRPVGGVVFRRVEAADSTGQVRPRLHAAAYFAPWDWVIDASAWESDFATERARVAALLGSVIWLCLGVGVALVALTLVAVRRMSIGITRPLDALTGAADRLATGDTSTEVPLDGVGEIGQLAASMHRMVEGERALAALARRIASGDFGEAPHARGDRDALAHSFTAVRQTVLDLTATLSALSEAAANGDLRHRPDPARFSGAFGDVVAGMNRTLDATLAPVHEALAVLERVAEGDLTASVQGTWHGDHAALVHALDAAVGAMRAAIEKIAAGSETLEQASRELRGATAQLGGSAREAAAQATLGAEAAAEANRQVAAVAVATEEMEASIREIAHSAATSAGVAEQAVQVAGRTAGTVERLGQSSREIGDVVGTIAKIAAKTNLLALNASIEAARAGVAGRGFAVVASEVKELARQTAQATALVRERIGRLQEDTATSVTAISEISAVIGELHGLQARIAVAVEEQSVTTREIARNVHGAARTTAEVAETLGSLAGVAGEVNVAVTQVDSVAGGLAEMTRDLGELVSSFSLVEAR